MNYIDILAKFLEIFPYYQETIAAFRTDGSNGIIATMRDGQNVSFTYFNDNNWRIGYRCY